jgi:hypothetical protein
VAEATTHKDYRVLTQTLKAAATEAKHSAPMIESLQGRMRDPPLLFEMWLRKEITS